MSKKQLILVIAVVAVAAHLLYMMVSEDIQEQAEKDAKIVEAVENLEDVMNKHIEHCYDGSIAENECISLMTLYRNDCKDKPDLVPTCSDARINDYLIRIGVLAEAVPGFQEIIVPEKDVANYERMIFLDKVTNTDYENPELCASTFDMMAQIYLRSTGQGGPTNFPQGPAMIQEQFLTHQCASNAYQWGSLTLYPQLLEVLIYRFVESEQQLHKILQEHKCASALYLYDDFMETIEYNEEQGSVYSEDKTRFADGTTHNLSFELESIYKVLGAC